MSQGKHVERQRRFYDTREHDHLQVRDDDLYAAKLARRMAERLEIRSDSRVLEVGAGFGRFTFPLLPHCGELVALDLSQVALERLDAERERRGIPRERLRTHCGEIDRVGDLDPAFDVVVGFFLLHHLPDVARSIARLAPLLRPGGRLGFLEPNRWNPLFLAQVAVCPDMTWAEERGMFALSRRGVEAAYRAAGLDVVPVGRSGFFPPQVFNPSPVARRLETWLEARSLLRGVLPFLELTARAPQRGAA